MYLRGPTGRGGLLLRVISELALWAHADRRSSRRRRVCAAGTACLIIYDLPNVKRLFSLCMQYHAVPSTEPRFSAVGGTEARAA